ncbi:putative membrane protein [Nocardia alba]|uniref:Putative membrane protein n=2 Tax=Nocardia alba TaxID=225051 RepID=A0A4R1G188_9NOCA|nr:putative membrane protein [Nocardia alba]
MADQLPRRRAHTYLSGLLFAMGILHFVAPKPFDKIVPPQLPGDPRTYTYGSGVAELGVAAALAVPRTRRLGGWLAAALFVGVYPANIQMTVDVVGNPKAPKVFKAGVLARLPLQIPMIVTALRIARG